MQNIYGCVNIMRSLESVEKSRGFSPGSWFLSVAYMFITVTKGEVGNILLGCRHLGVSWLHGDVTNVPHLDIFDFSDLVYYA